MVPFAGYLLPVQYKDGIVQNHQHIRKDAGLFDVSHMGQVNITGEKAGQFLESVVVGDVLGLKENQCRLTVLTNTEGGCIDDCMVTKKKDNHYFMVLNAGCKEKDLAHMRNELQRFNKQHGADVAIDYIGDARSLIALQGPAAHTVLARHIGANGAHEVASLPFMYTREITLGDVPCWVTRCGYTGEDGFEISIPSGQVAKVFNALLENKEVKPAGLGVRDSLRLEAGLCLYGHELDEKTTPIEAGLAWTIGKRRREQGGFPGASIILNQIAKGPAKKRVGLIVHKGAPARENAPIKTADGKTIGVVTSGTHSPSLNKPISMGYVESAFAVPGTTLLVEVRGRQGEAEVVKLPFVPARYYKGGNA